MIAGKLALGLLLLAPVLVACSQSSHDTVVGVLLECKFRPSPTGQFQDASGGICSVKDVQYAFGAFQRVTVKTGDGKTYTADVDADTKVKIGDRWPP